MPLIKDTANISQLNALVGDNAMPVAGFLRFVNAKTVKRAAARLEGLKEQGFAAQGVLLLLLIMPLLGLKNVHSFLHSELASLSSASKDVFYRLINNPLIDWRKLQYGFVKEFLAKSVKPVATDHRPGKKKAAPTCFIVDDTIAPKTGRRIEGAGMLFDHAIGRHVLGLKYLFLVFWDGSALVPLDFSVHREKGKNAKKPFGLKIKHWLGQFRKDRPEWTPGFKRNKELDTDKISATIKMLRRAAKNGISADYLLVDSWFVCDSLIKESILSMKIGHIMGQAKNDKRKYGYNGGEYTGEALKKMLILKWKRCKRFRMEYLQVNVDYKGTPLRLFFTRLHGCQKERLLLTSDRSLKFTDAFEIYAIRWTIEVFFKDSKQLLGLGKCQSNDFDAQIAAATICMMQYTALAHQKRVGSYQTLGGLFRDCKQQATEALLSERILASIVKMLAQLGSFLGIDWQDALGQLINDEAFGRQMAAILNALAQLEANTKAEPNDQDHNTFKKSA